MAEKSTSSLDNSVNDGSEVDMERVGGSTSFSNSNGEEAMKILADAFSADDFDVGPVDLANEDPDFVESRKEQLAKELEEEEKRKVEERKRMLYRITHGIDSDSEKEDEKDDNDGIHFTEGQRVPTSNLKTKDEQNHVQSDIGDNTDTSNQNHVHDDDDISQGSEIENGGNAHSDVIEDDLSDGEEDENQVDLNEGEDGKTGTMTMNDKNMKEEVQSNQSLKNSNVSMPSLDAPVLNKNDIEEEDSVRGDTSGSLSDIEKFIKMNEKDDGNGTLLYRHLKSGFDFVHRELTKEKLTDANGVRPVVELDGLPSTFVESINRMPLVNFIDPTSSAISNTPTHKAWKPTRVKPKLNSLQIFDKFNTLFRKQGSALNSVAYRNLNTGEVKSIEHLPIRTQLTAPMVADPSEWHNSPLCHIYIAACTSVEHYRAKVRPSLRAFVNQVDGAGSGNAKVAASAAAQAAKKEYSATKKSGDNKREQIAAARKAVAEAKNIGAGANASCQYLIIFVPIRPSSVETDLPKMQDDSSKGGGIGLRGRFGGRRNSSGDHNKNARNSESNGDDTNDDETAGDGSHPPSGTPAFVTLSKEHRDVYNKFRKDFPNGRACILASLLDSDTNLAPVNKVQTQEFNQVLKEIGKSVLSGFIDRVRRYKEELDRFDKDHKKRMEENIDDASTTDWARYFLIKESLAFTYEQMRLIDDAIRMYDELDIRLPRSSEMQLHDENASNDIIATLGHTEGFRKIVRTTGNMVDISHLSSKYIFARHSLLLFLQKRAKAALDKLLSYTKKVTMKQTENDGLELQDSNLSLRKEVWAIGVCWETRVATDKITAHVFRQEKDMSTEKLDSQHADKNLSIFSSKGERIDYLRSLCDILSFARSSAMNLSSSLFPPGALIHKAMAETPIDTLRPWVPWNEIESHEEQKEEPPIQNKHSLIPLDTMPTKNHCEWLRNAIECERHFEDAYLELSEAIVELNTLLNRHRCVCRILAEVAEINVLRGDLDTAVKNLLKTIDTTARDPWDSLLSWRVFRLLCCQRKLKSEHEYFKSLTYCLGSRLSGSIPQKLRKLLHEDLEVLVCNSALSENRLGISPLFSFKVDIKETAGGKFSLPLLTNNLSMHSCQVGDSVETVFHCISSLAKPIELQRVKILLVDVNDYQRLTEATDIVTEEDAAFMLSTDVSISIQPGQNTIKFPWSAMAVGQYVVACICIEWKSVMFYHDFTRRPRGVLGFDVIPNDPTQSIELNPIFLIPGHIQNVRLLFHAGSDVVNSGNISFKCSKGLQVMLPDSEASNEWKNSCNFSVGQCLPGSTTTVIVSVKSEAIGSYDPTSTEPSEEASNFSNLQTLKASMTTSYHHGLYASYIEKDKKIDTNPMKALLEASVTTLERAALTIEKCGAFAIGEKFIVISATVLCNTPVPFSLKEWSISLPPQICLDDNGDMNVGLFDSSVIEGEELYFGFRCRRNNETSELIDASGFQSPILTVVLQDHFGKTFRQVLPLSIRALHSMAMADQNNDKTSYAEAELKASKTDGLIGAPVQFTYDIDCSGIKQTEDSQILYRISCTETDWIVGGSVRGVLEKSSPTLSQRSVSFVGIPTKAGYLKKFPHIELALPQSKSSYEYMSNGPKIKVKEPGPFLCSVHDNVDALACPSTLVDI